MSTTGANPGPSSTSNARSSSATRCTLIRGSAGPIADPAHSRLDCPFAFDASARKLADKRYHRHSGYPGGLSSESLEHLMERKPERVVRLAIRGMLPKTRLGRAQIRKLRIYDGPTHPHAAQMPQPRLLASKR